MCCQSAHGPDLRVPQILPWRQSAGESRNVRIGRWPPLPAKLDHGKRLSTAGSICPFEARSDHTVTADVTAGRHVLALRFVSGKASSGLAMGGPKELRKVPRDAWVGEACDLWTSAQPPERDGSVEHDDYVALVIGPDRSRGTWSRFVVNPAGALLDERSNGEQADRAHDFNCEWAAKVYPDRWTAEMRVPLSEMSINPASDPVIRMNLSRSIAGDGSRREIMTWYPQPTRGPHWVRHNLGWCILRDAPDEDLPGNGD